MPSPRISSTSSYAIDAATAEITDSFETGLKPGVPAVTDTTSG